MKWGGWRIQVVIAAATLVSSPPPRRKGKRNGWFRRENSRLGMGMAEGLALPKGELINRRKSPALWREDLAEKTAEGEADSDAARRSIIRRVLEKGPPEVMSPVGGWPQLRAAVGNGADAVYLGLQAYSARARADNFDAFDGELAEAVRYCHEHGGVKVYVAFNTLVFDDELAEVERLLRATADAGVDALIVQDVGVAKLARRLIPSVQVHASTQQSITSSDGALFARDQCEATRVVVGRELSIAEMQSVVQTLGDSQVQVEAFVHGALCVSYSGQCFSSESWGGRSANRGQCAQACRLPYGLIADGELRELGDFQYLLSPQDLCGIDHVPALLRSGLSCLKIEGRLKDAAYVAATTRAYRHAVDRAWEDLVHEEKHRQPHHLSPPMAATTNRRLDNAAETVSKGELIQLFARGQDDVHDGLSDGFLTGTRHQTVVRGRSPRHRGVHLGFVDKGSSPHRGIVVRSPKSFHLPFDHVKRGDGIVIDRGDPQGTELGGPIFDIQRLSPDRVLLQFGRDVERQWKDAQKGASFSKSGRRNQGSSNENLAPLGAHVWKTSDAAVDRKMKRLAEAPPPRQLVEVYVSGSLGTPVSVKLIDLTSGRQAEGSSEENLVSAERSGITPDQIRKAVGTLGNTRWGIGNNGNIDTSALDKGLWCPMSWVKEARRKAVEQLESELQNAKGAGFTGTIVDDAISGGMTSQLLQEKTAEAWTEAPLVDSPGSLSILARTFEQVTTVCELVEQDHDAGAHIAEVIVDFLEVEGMREAVERIRRTNGLLKAVVASPRIIKPGEAGIWRTLLRLEPDGLLVRSTGLLFRMQSLGGTGAAVNVGTDEEEQWVQIPPMVGDFSLNVANALTAMELLSCGLERVTTSYDLGASSITDLAHLMGENASRRLEVVAHAKLPIFHTEHCVFARFLSKGNSFLDCGHACTRHSVYLRDQTGADNLVLADMGCRNTVFAAQAQSGAHSLKEWVAAGVGRIRVELVDEHVEDVTTIVRGYLDVLTGQQGPSEVWESLQKVRDSNGRAHGISHGSLRNTRERRAGEI